MNQEPTKPENDVADRIRNACKAFQEFNRVVRSLPEETLQKLRRCQTRQMKTLSTLCVLCVLCVSSFAGDDKSGVLRDANGRIISRVDRTATGTTARDASGAVTEHRSTRKNADGTRTITVRDAAGKVIRTEEKKR